MAQLSTSTVTDTTEPALRPFVDQWAARLTTFRRDGQPVHTPVNIVVVGDRLVFRTYASAWKCTRLDRNPAVELAPCDVRGRATGSSISGLARRLDGRRAETAAAAIDTKYPFFQRTLIHFGHRLRRLQTVHYEIMAVPSHDG